MQITSRAAAAILIAAGIVSGTSLARGASLAINPAVKYQKFTAWEATAQAGQDKET